MWTNSLEFLNPYDALTNPNLTTRDKIKLANANLKTCPFCGGIAKIRYIPQPPSVFDDNQELIDMYEVMCHNCFVTTDSYQTIEETFTSWNKRVGDVG